MTNQPKSMALTIEPLFIIEPPDAGSTDVVTLTALDRESHSRLVLAAGPRAEVEPILTYLVFAQNRAWEARNMAGRLADLEPVR